MSENIHALAQQRAECAAHLNHLRKLGAADWEGIDDLNRRRAEAEARYQAAEDAYQRAVSMLTTAELIAMGLAP